MAKNPDDMLVNVTFHDVKRSKADEIMVAAAKINDGIAVTMETSGEQYQKNSDEPFGNLMQCSRKLTHDDHVWGENDKWHCLGLGV